MTRHAKSSRRERYKERVQQRRSAAAGAHETAHLGATEDQVVPTMTPGSTERAFAPPDPVDREIDPTDEITPG